MTRNHAIRFAGDHEVAVVADGARGGLVRWDERVAHYEVDVSA